MKKNFCLTLVIILLSLSPLFADKKDSLINCIGNSKSDSANILTLRELTYYHLFEEYDLDQAINYLDEAISKSKLSKNHFLAGKMMALKGYVEQFYSNNFASSISNYFAALNEYDLAGVSSEKYAIYLNLGNLYHSYEQYEDAINFLNKAIENAKKRNSDLDQAEAMLNLGVIYSENIDQNKAVECLNYAKNYFESVQDSLNLSIAQFSLTNIAILKDNVDLEDRVRAINTYEKVRRIFEIYQLTDYYLGATSNLAGQLTKIGNYTDAHNYLVEARNLAEDMNNFRLLIDVYANLADNSEKQLNYKQQVLYLKKVAEYNDSLFNEAKAKAISETEIKYETEKINAQNEILQKEGVIKDLELSASKTEAKAQEQQKYYLFGGLGLVALFGVFMFNRFRVTNKQKNIIDEQKTIVEKQKEEVERQKNDLEITHHALAEKNQEIMDSIHYAKRIQAAVLPSKSRVDQLFSDGFILYKPKDIVAGDFYWMEEKNDYLLYAAADCTGHGVPGAMVSVICNNGLNRSVRELGLTDPGRILDNTREIVTKEFEKSDEEVQDGMDISLCSIDYKNRKLLWSGANNPLWIIRKGELMVYKPNKQPIGRYASSKPFDTHEIDIQENDQLYTFTDGYQDQFGGPKGKKMMVSRMKKYILSISDRSMSEQKILLETHFENWKNNEEQIDDVCIIGLRIQF